MIFLTPWQHFLSQNVIQREKNIEARNVTKSGLALKYAQTQKMLNIRGIRIEINRDRANTRDMIIIDKSSMKGDNLL